jgi:hypothetical protein
MPTPPMVLSPTAAASLNQAYADSTPLVLWAREAVAD